MPSDKFTATWVSHSSMSDFLKCPRAYFLKNVYKNPDNGRKMNLMSPPLALGQAVHEVVESLSVLPVEQRFSRPLTERFEIAWKKISGKKGGYASESQEEKYKQRGAEMIRRVVNNPGPLKNKAVKIKMDLPNFWLSEPDEIILCGKIDWLEYFPETDAVHIIDFKTGTHEEDEQSLQLPIYHMLVANCQQRDVVKASYWYLNRNDDLSEKVLPNLNEAQEKILKVAKEIKLARKLERFKCPQGENGCYACRPFEAVLRGEAEFVGLDEYNREIYISKNHDDDDGEESVVL